MCAWRRDTEAPTLRDGALVSSSIAALEAAELPSPTRNGRSDVATHLHYAAENPNPEPTMRTIPLEPSKHHSPRDARDDGDAFILDVVRRGGDLAKPALAGGHPTRRNADDESEAFAEEFIAAATSADDTFEEARDEIMLEEIGGPFVEEAHHVRARGASRRRRAKKGT
jgi:hypothetical protein